MDFNSYYLLTELTDWRERRVLNTKTGNRVLVKSLPPSEQHRYKPFYLKKKDADAGKEVKDEFKPVREGPRIFDVYYSADVREGGYKAFQEGKYVVATDDSAKAIEIEEAGHKIAVAHKVPIDAFKKYYDYETQKFITFPKDMNSEKKFELIEYRDNDVYLVDFYTFRNDIEFNLSNPEDKEYEI